MRYAFAINFEGSATIRPNEDGGTLVALRGSGAPPESTDQWQLSLQPLSHGVSTTRPALELEILGPLGDRIQAVPNGEALDAITNGAGSVEGDLLEQSFAVVGGTGGFAGAGGTVRLHGTILPQEFFLTADLDLDAPAAIWQPPNARPLSPAEDASGGSHVGPQPLSQKQAESEAEERLVRRAQQRPD